MRSAQILPSGQVFSDIRCTESDGSDYQSWKQYEQGATTFPTPDSPRAGPRLVPNLSGRSSVRDLSRSDHNIVIVPVLRIPYTFLSAFPKDLW